MSNPKSLTLITQNKKMRDILSRIDRIADSSSSVLLIGETGVGKEIIAEYIHRTSSRAQNPFVKISLSALPAALLESELFGHEKGAFTSASNEKKGLFEMANTGSIFLDDIDDVPLEIQAKLLRVLESGEQMRIGGTRPVPIDVRLITASKIDLKTLVEKNIFRSDLFYRINVVPINLPALRERRDDIKPLVEHFVKHFSNGKALKISQQAIKALINYPWPGNVRELKNLIHRLTLFVEEEISEQDLPIEIRGGTPIQDLVKACHKCYIDEEMSLDQIVSCLEHNLLKEALKESYGNQTKAAKSLGLSLSTFRDKIQKYQLRELARSKGESLRKSAD